MADLRATAHRLCSRLGRRLPEGPSLDDRIERSLWEAREQHRLLVEQASVVVAGQTRARARLEQAVVEYERATAETQEALLLADRREREHDPEGAAAQQRAAASTARRMVRLESEIDELTRSALEATEASDTAKGAVAQSAAMLRARLQEGERMLSRLDQARLQEQVNATRAQLDLPIGSDVPGLDEARRSIEARLATARALAEIRPVTIDELRLEVDQERANAAVHAKLETLREPLGLGLHRAAANADVPLAGRSHDADGPAQERHRSVGPQR